MLGVVSKLDSQTNLHSGQAPGTSQTPHKENEERKRILTTLIFTLKRTLQSMGPSIIEVRH